MNKRHIVKIDRKRTQDAYVQWLDTFEWSYWCTGTTNYELTLKSARSLMERFYKNLQKHAFFLGNKPTLFWVAEPFDCRDGFHTHFLMKVHTDIPYDELKKIWNLSCGKSNSEFKHRFHIEKYNKEKGARSYCIKYIQKKLSDYDLHV
jgi:hypothetical protein